MRTREQHTHTELTTVRKESSRLAFTCDGRHSVVISVQELDAVVAADAS